MRNAYRYVAHLIALLVVLQAAWIALSMFTLIKDVDDGKIVDKSYEGNVGDVLHGIFGMGVIPLLALVLLIISFFTRSPGASRWAGFVVLAVVLQIVFAFLSFGVPVLGVLHGVNAFAVLAMAEIAARRGLGAPPVGASAQPVTV